jgi:hypothetical protein
MLDRLVRLRTPRSRSMRVALAVVGVGLFAVLVLVAVRHLPEDLGGVQWWLVVLAAVVGVPLTLGVNAVEYRQQAHLAGVPLDYRTALRVSLAGSAANLLPVPGSVLVRVAHLRRADAPYRTITLATAVVASTYVAVALAVGGIAVLAFSPLAGIVALAAGVVLGGVAATLTRSCAPAQPWRTLAGLAAIELASIAVGTLRIGLLLAALGHASVGGAVSLVVADVVAGALGFLPAGLGLRELLAALLGPLADVPASVSVVATALDRVITIVVVGLASVVASRRRH